MNLRLELLIIIQLLSLWKGTVSPKRYPQHIGIASLFKSGEMIGWRYILPVPQLNLTGVVV